MFAAQTGRQLAEPGEPHQVAASGTLMHLFRILIRHLLQSHPRLLQLRRPA